MDGLNRRGNPATVARRRQRAFYVAPDGKLMAVEIKGSGAFDAAAPRALFQLSPGAGPPAQLSNVSSPDGQRFLFTVTVPP